MLWYAKQAETRNADQDTLVRLIDELESWIVSILGLFGRNNFRRNVLCLNLDSYVAAKLSDNSTHFNIGTHPPLLVAFNIPHALILTHRASPQRQYPHDFPVDVLRVLLDHGQDLNRPFVIGGDCTVTPWGQIVRNYFSLHTPRDAKYKDFLSSGIISMFLRKGADPNAYFYTETRAPGRKSVFGQFLLTFLDFKSTRHGSPRPLLMALEDFLEAGADLDIQQSFDGPLIGPLGPLRTESVCDAFSATLESRALTWSTDSPEDQNTLSLLETVTYKLLAHGVARNSNITLLVECIPRVFPLERADILMRIVPMGGQA
jgi:hypothetical protein